MSEKLNDHLRQRILSTLPQKRDAIIKSIPEYPPQVIGRAIGLMIKRGEVAISDDLYIAVGDPS